MLGFAVFFIAVMTLSAYPVAAFFFGSIGESVRKNRRVFVKLGASVLLGCMSYFSRMLALAVLHLMVLLPLSKMLYRCVGCLRRNERAVGIYKSGAVPIVITAGMLVFGYFNINYVEAAAYQLSSDKLSRDYKVVFLSDIHYATVQRREVLSEKVREINALQPDLILLGGDLLDEGTSREEMHECFAALGGLESTYGTYYVHGNHDRQRYSAAPTYTEIELQQALESSDITVLCEASAKIGSDLQLLGREDLGSKSGRDAVRLNIDPERFVITVDHQPFDAEDNALLGSDLQLSGHTHGGQIFPLGLFEFFYQGYPYGEYAVKDMTLLVSSGFAGWGFPVRTQGRSEYLVIDLTADNGMIV